MTTNSEIAGARRLILLRHGRTEWNAAGRFQGHSDIPLDELGIAQATLAAPTLSQEPISEIWSSDLSRAMVTVKAVADLLGLAVNSSAELREMNVGTWEGLSRTEIEQLAPGYQERLARGDDFRRSETGETVAEVGIRVAAELTRIAGLAPEGSTVLIGTHGVAASAGTQNLIGLPVEIGRPLVGLGNCHWADLRRTPAARVAAGGPAWQLQAWNVCAPGAVA